MTKSISIQLVELRSAKYSVPNRSIGYIESELDNIPNHVVVCWAFNPGPGGSSVPICLDDLFLLGELRVLVPDNDPGKEVL